MRDLSPAVERRWSGRRRSSSRHSHAIWALKSIPWKRPSEVPYSGPGSACSCLPTNGRAYTDPRCVVDLPPIPSLWRRRLRTRRSTSSSTSTEPLMWRCSRSAVLRGPQSPCRSRSARRRGVPAAAAQRAPPDSLSAGPPREDARQPRGSVSLTYRKAVPPATATQWSVLAHDVSAGSSRLSPAGGTTPAPSCMSGFHHVAPASEVE